MRIAVADSAAAEALKPLLPTTALAEPTLEQRFFSLGNDTPRGMTLRWDFAAASQFRGLEAEAAADRLPELARTGARAAEQARAALALWQSEHAALELPAGALKLYEVQEIKFGEIIRGLNVRTALSPGPELDSLEAAVQAVLPGAAVARRSEPYNYAFAPEPAALPLVPDERQREYERELLHFPLASPQRFGWFGENEIAQLFTPDELASYEAQAQQIEAAVLRWNAEQPAADRVTVKRQLRGTALTGVSILGERPELERVLSLGRALDLPGVMPYKYGMGFISREHGQQRQWQPNRSPSAYLAYRTVPTSTLLPGRWTKSRSAWRAITPRRNWSS